jgi:hypothetical protein
MFERVLPIGTVVLLKEAKKRVMIIGYCKYNGDDRTKIYDYAGCVFPEGYISPETTALFNHEDIDVIFSLGFRNGLQHDFQLKLEEALENVHNANTEEK